MHTKNKLNLNSGEDQRQKKIISKGGFAKFRKNDCNR